MCAKRIITAVKTRTRNSFSDMSFERTYLIFHQMDACSQTTKKTTYIFNFYINEQNSEFPR